MRPPWRSTIVRHKSQSQAAARNVVAVEPRQWFKNPILIVGRDSQAIILHSKLRGVSGSAA